jgi:hypothetical protein
MIQGVTFEIMMAIAFFFGGEGEGGACSDPGRHVRDRDDDSGGHSRDRDDDPRASDCDDDSIVVIEVIEGVILDRDNDFSFFFLGGGVIIRA